MSMGRRMLTNFGMFAASEVLWWSLQPGEDGIGSGWANWE